MVPTKVQEYRVAYPIICDTRPLATTNNLPDGTHECLNGACGLQCLGIELHVELVQMGQQCVLELKAYSPIAYLDDLEKTGFDL